jgi:TatA/E family protein of Tat protein translocase
MPGLPDTAVIVLLALLLFGPKKLPVLARQLGKLMADFRRASNEFRTQMEEELRISEQADRQNQIAAIEAAAPPSPAIRLRRAAPRRLPHRIHLRTNLRIRRSSRTAPHRNLRRPEHYAAIHRTARTQLDRGRHPRSHRSGPPRRA